MTMTHKEALAKAIEAFYTEVDNLDGSDMEAAIRAYIEARGMVLVPKEPDEAMIGFGWDGYNGFSKPSNKMCNAYRRMITAAPDPFKDDAP